jgi:hypothetical protein
MKKNILLIIILILLRLDTIYSQMRLPSLEEVEIHYFHLLDSLSKQKRLNFISGNDINYAYNNIPIDLKKENQSAIIKKRSTVIKQIINTIDTLENSIDWAYEKNKKIISLSNYPPVLDETDSVKTVYANMPPTYLKNLSHRKLYIAYLRQKKEELEYRSYQQDLIGTYNDCYYYLDRAFQKYYNKTEVDKREIIAIIGRYGKNQNSLTKFVEEKFK